VPEGFLEVELTGAGVVDTINRASEKGIVLYGVRWLGDLCVKLRVSVSDFFQLRKLAASRGDELVICSKRGLRFWIQSMMRRPIMIISVLGILLLSLWLPGRVLFVAVEGNETVNSQLILQTAEECGIYFGAERVVVRSEAVKNKMLEKLPQLQWVGVNTSGCTALISVRENVAMYDVDRGNGLSNIVACRDGVILSVTATSGVAQCKVGDAVTKGQILISGRTDEGILCKITRSQGEVFAQTNRACAVLTPTVYMKFLEPSSKKQKYSLLIGKKRINLSKGSGISYAGYDKIYTEYCVMLPGGFALPLAFVVEEYIAFEQEPFTCDVESCASEAADRYVMEQMVSGKINSRSLQYEVGSDTYKLFADYLCTEMIGCERGEELEFFNGEDNRTNGER